MKAVNPLTGLKAGCCGYLVPFALFVEYLLLYSSLWHLTDHTWSTEDPSMYWPALAEPGTVSPEGRQSSNKL